MLRLLLPQNDRERAIYGLKEKNIAKMYIKLIPLGPKDPDAIRLLDWKKPSGPDVSYPTRRLQLVVICCPRGLPVTSLRSSMRLSRNDLQSSKEV